MKFYVGTYTDLGGPGACAAEARDGKISIISACRAIDNPNYLIKARDGQTLYAAASSEGKGAVASYRVCGGELSPLSLQLSGGMDTCHIALSGNERYLYAVNYSSGSVSAFPVKDGYIMPRAQLIKHGAGSGVNAKRQEAAHTHHAAFRPGANELFICDLGMDEICVYAQDADAGLLTLAYGIQAAPGCGPRHLLFDGADQFFLACELSNEIKRYVFEGGTWRCAQTLSTLPEGATCENTVAAIRCLDGDIYVSNRGYDSVARFSVNERGDMERKEIIRVNGRCPRDILPLGGNSLIAANQDSGTVEWIRDGQSVSSAPVPAAVCLLGASN